MVNSTIASNQSKRTNRFQKQQQQHIFKNLRAALVLTEEDAKRAVESFTGARGKLFVERPVSVNLEVISSKS
jgi:hypothetical protein